MTHVEAAVVEKTGIIRRIYDWSMAWIQTPYGTWALFILAVAESSFFPIPPDLFLIALCIANQKKCFFYAAVCSAGSVLGGMAGYALGLGFMDVIGTRILEWYGLDAQYAVVQNLFQRYDGWAVAAAGFTPLPYKLFTISAGAFRIDFLTFVVASVFSRTVRFVLVAGFIFLFGPSVRYFIERYFNLLATLFFLLLVGGFFVLKFLL